MSISIAVSATVVRYLQLCLCQSGFDSLFSPTAAYFLASLVSPKGKLPSSSAKELSSCLCQATAAITMPFLLLPLVSQSQERQNSPFTS